jgi:hypothetical protein
MESQGGSASDALYIYACTSPPSPPPPSPATEVGLALSPANPDGHVPDETNPIFPSAVTGPDAAKLNQNLQNALIPSPSQFPPPPRDENRLSQADIARSERAFRMEIETFSHSNFARGKAETLPRPMQMIEWPNVDPTPGRTWEWDRLERRAWLTWRR